MATAINAATAFVTIRLERALFRRELQGANQQLNDLALGAARVGGAFLTMGIIATGALVRITKSASDAVEAANRFNQVFRAAGSGAATAWAEQFANSVGRARTQVKDTLSTFQGFFVGLGFGADQAEVFSRNLTTATVDFASFNNIADDDAVRRFIGALSGSPETLDKFGFNVREAAVNQELLAMGIKKTTRTATEQEKAVAKMNIILRTMGKLGAAGDAVRTADEYANVLKRLQSSFENLSETLGAQIIPSMKEFASSLTSLLTNSEKLAKAFPGLSKSVFYAATAFTALGVAVLGAAVAIQTFNILSTVQALRTFGSAIATLLGPVRTLVTLIGSIAAGMSTLGLTAIITGIAAMAVQTYKALGYWKDMKVAIAEASEAQDKMNKMQDDRIEQNKRNLAGEGDPLIVKADEEAKRLAILEDLKKKEQDYMRRIEKMEKHGRQRGNFATEMFRQMTIGDTAERGGSRFGDKANEERHKKLKEMYEAGGLKKLEAMSQGYYGDFGIDASDAGNRSKFAYDKEEMEREKRNLDAVRRQIREMNLQEKTKDLPEKKKMTSQDFIDAIKQSHKDIDARKDAAQKVIWMQKKASDARNKAAKEAGEEAGKAVSKFMQQGIDKLIEISDRYSGVFKQAADEVESSQERLDELRSQTRDARGAFGSMSGASIMRTGGIFGMRDMKEEKELRSRIKAAKALMDMIEKKFGKDWRKKVEEDRENSRIFQNAMNKLGAI